MASFSCGAREDRRRETAGVHTPASTGVPHRVAAIAVAILKYRLFDVDRVASRAIAYGTLAALVTALYIGLVVVVGTLLGWRA
jgi:hypothetical protein